MHKDTEALKERLRQATTAPKRRTYTKRVKPKATAKEVAEFVSTLKGLTDLMAESKLEREAVIWQAYKAGVSKKTISEAIGLTEGSTYEHIKLIRRKLNNLTK